MLGRCAYLALLDGTVCLQVQYEATSAVTQAFLGAGHRRATVVLPGGAGKTGAAGLAEFVPGVSSEQRGK